MNKEQLACIIRKCKKGDKLAFKNLMLKYTNYVFALAFRMLNSEEDAKDIIQETFLRVWNNIGNYNEQIKITTWIYKIATNLCLDKIKTQKRKPVINIELVRLQQYIADDNINERLSNQQLAEVIIQLSENLTPKQKLVFVLNDIEGLEPDEIEEITGMQKGQIKSNLYYARQEIRNKLTQIGYEV